MSVFTAYRNTVAPHGTTIFIMESTKQQDSWSEQVQGLLVGRKDLLAEGMAWELLEKKYRRWLVEAEKFMGMFGLVLVPLDLREHIITVQGELNLEETEFPAQVGCTPGVPNVEGGEQVDPEMAEMAAAGILKAAPLNLHCWDTQENP